jgi:hypothetical protein
MARSTRRCCLRLQLFPERHLDECLESSASCSVQSQHL